MAGMHCLQQLCRQQIKTCGYAASSLLAKHSFMQDAPSVSISLKPLSSGSSLTMLLSCEVKTHTMHDIHQLAATCSSLCIISLVLDLAAEVFRCEAGAFGNPHPGL